MIYRYIDIPQRPRNVKLELKLKMGFFYLYLVPRVHWGDIMYSKFIWLDLNKFRQG